MPRSAMIIDKSIIAKFLCLGQIFFSFLFFFIAAPKFAFSADGSMWS